MDDGSRFPSSESDRPLSGRSRAQTWMLAILSLLAVTWFLRSTPMVTMPIAAALLIALGVWPIARKVCEKVPDKLSWLGAAAAFLVVIAALAIFLTGLAFAAREVVQLLVDVAPQLERALSRFGLSMPTDQAGLQSAVRSFSSQALAALDTTLTTAAVIILILFLVLLMLTETRNWHDKVDTVTGHGGHNRWEEIAASVGQKFRAFFLTRLILGVITAVLYVGWLAIFGVDYLLLWGILTILLNLIPTVGSLISGALPVLYAIVQRDVATAAIIAAGLLTIEQVMGNFVDPKVMGRRLAMSPLVVLASLLFWSWVWGIAGALLAVPLTVLVTMVCAHFDRLKPIALLLTTESNFEELERYRRPK